MANSDKNIRITTSKNKTTYPNIVFTGSAAGSSVITLEVLDDNTLSFTSNEGQVFSIDSNLSTGTIWAVSDISGVPLLSSSAGGTVGLAVYGGIVGIGQTNPIYKLDLKGSFGLASSNDSLYNFIFSNSAASGSNSLQIRSANSLLLYNSGNTFYTGFKSGANTVNYTLSLPTAPVGAGSSVIVTGSDGQMYFAAPGSGIAFSSATANTPIIRAKRPIALQFSSGYTPAAAGADTVILRVPESATDGTTVLTYNLRRFQVRVETPSTGSSRLQLERSSTDTGTFTLAATGSSHIGGFGVTIVGAGIYLTSVTSFSGTLVTSGNLLRLNWTLLNATHANFSAQLLLEEV